MNRERAQYLLATRVMGGNFRYGFPHRGEHRIYPDGITAQEHQAILALWNTMPGYTSYYCAVCRIAKGEA